MFHIKVSGRTEWENSSYSEIQLQPLSLKYSSMSKRQTDKTSVFSGQRGQGIHASRQQQEELEVDFLGQVIRFGQQHKGTRTARGNLALQSSIRRRVEEKVLPRILQDWSTLHIYVIQVVTIYSQSRSSISSLSQSPLSNTAYALIRKTLPSL